MNELAAKRIFRVNQRAASANNRFPDKITGDEVYQVLVKFDFKCFYCSQRIIASKWQLDHFFPRANKGKNEFNNLVPCCKWCNTMKNALDGNSFIKKCSEIVDFNYFKQQGISDSSVQSFNGQKFKKRNKRVIHFISEIPQDELTDEIRYIYELCTLEDLNDLMEKPRFKNK